MSDDKSNVFFRIIAVIGAVLIFVGIAWLIAWNWQKIPDFLKVLILVFATLVSFSTGVLARIKEYEGTGRALLVLGAGLYMLSLFLISQIYHLATTMQHYTWLLFLGWTVIYISSYLLKSYENILVSLLIFFPWIILQYISSITQTSGIGEGYILGLILIFLSVGVLLYSLSIFHNSIKHIFTNVYRFWTVFYFLLVFYVLSFQTFLPIIGNFAFESGAFTIFLMLIIMTSVLVFILSILFAASKQSIEIKEILIFLGVIIILCVLVMATKPISGILGTCYPKSCYDFNTESSCNSAPSILNCQWYGSSENIVRDSSPQLTEGYCREFNCYDFRNESSCNSESRCNWENNYCVLSNLESINSKYSFCNKYDNKGSQCQDQEECKWNPSFISSRGAELPFFLWFVWVISNIFFIGFIILILGYGQLVGSTKIINLGLLAFVIEIISRYIGFWMQLQGYFWFSILAILGGIILILGSWLIPKWRKSLIQSS
ncbi:MAG: DUF2157 domain-containing protein [archaeon]